VNTIQAPLFAILQAITELFPVSSLGHAVVLPALLGWSVDQKAPDFLPFLVALHLGTAVALLLYFWAEWLGIFLALLGGGSIEDRRAARRLLLRLVLATIPAAAIGFVFENLLQLLFGTPIVAAYVSVSLLMRYFKRREFDALDPFAYYCWGAGGVASILLAVA
jgi:undecaprenyl-diphosphatase